MKNKIVGVRVKIKNIYTLPLKSECKCFNAFTPTLTTKKIFAVCPKLRTKILKLKTARSLHV